MNRSFNTLLGTAIEAACDALPEGYVIEMSIERGAATVILYNPDGEQISPELGEWDGDELPEEIHDFVVLANTHAAGEKASHRTEVDRG